MGDKSFFYFRRLGSLLGIFPLAFFVILYFFILSVAFNSIDSLNNFLIFVGKIPFYPVLFILFIFVPILIHFLIGIIVTTRSSFNLFEYSYFDNFLLFIEGISQIICFLFVMFHLWNTSIKAIIHGIPVNFDIISSVISGGHMLIFYILGVLSLAVYLSLSIIRFSNTWGIVASGRSHRLVSIKALFCFFIISGWGVSLVFYFHG